MKELHYYIAISLDGFIADINGKTESFLHSGPHVADYLNKLKSYSAAIMGRHTYQAGYDYGLKPGQIPYPWLKNIIISDNLTLANKDPDLQIISRARAIQCIQDLKSDSEDLRPIYLCGGGILASRLLNAGLIDRLILKVNPHLLGTGKALFQSSTSREAWTLTQHHVYENGIVELNYVRN